MRGVDWETAGKRERTYKQHHCSHQNDYKGVAVLALHLFTTFLQHPPLEDVLCDSQIWESGISSQYIGEFERSDGDPITSPDFIAVIEVWGMLNPIWLGIGEMTPNVERGDK
jgi:hypothetical protein